MASVFEAIESSYTIQSAKAEFAEAQKNGDQAGMDRARAKAENFRQTYGGYSTIGDGSAIKDIVNSSKYNEIFNEINNLTEETKTSANNIINKVTEKINNTSSEINEKNNNDTVTVIDSGYNASDYSISSNISTSSTSFDTYLGYGLIGLIIIAVLSRFIGK